MNQVSTTWRVGEFFSSSTPDKKVLCLVLGDDIARDEKRSDFIRWVSPAADVPPLPEIESASDIYKPIVSIERGQIFKPDGTLRGVSYGSPSTHRGAVLNITIDRKKAKKLTTALIVDGKDFDEVYRQMVDMIADHFEVTQDFRLVESMVDSKHAFLAVNGLVTRTVCRLQVSRAD